MNKKLVFYVGNFDKPDANAAGKRVYGVALILVKLGYRVVLIGKSKLLNTDEYPIQYGKNIVYYSFPGVSLINTKAFVDYVVNIMKTEGTPQFVVRYGSPGLCLFDKKMVSLCKKKGIKLIADVVDWLSSAGNNPIFNFIKTTDTYFEKAIYNKKSNGVIAISSYLSDYYAEAGCKTLTIPPLVGDYLKNEGTNNKIRIVYAGIPFRLGRMVKKADEVKDRLDLVVKAIGSLDKTSVKPVLDIYGITEDQYLTAYPNHKTVLDKNKDTICFYGNKPMDEVQKAVRNADFVILIRDKNRATMAGFPTKVVESLSMGTPVITTDTSDLSKYIIQGKTGFFVDATDEKRLANQLAEICEIDEEKLSRMKQCCYESRDFCAERFTNIFSEFINNL